MIEAYKKFWQNYATFTGRSRRSDYWYVVLANAIIGFILGLIFRGTTLNVITSLYSLATLVPSLAVCARRLHDIGKSGLFILISLIPLVGGIILLVWCVTDSQQGTNQYGPNPKENA